MAPTHVMNNFIGVKEMAFGGSGYDGKAALEKVIKRLRQGWSTFITPDGPSGPLKKIKKGVILMSSQGNTPIIPISFHLTKEYRINSWDRKRYPLPFAKITVCYKPPIWVKDEEFDFYQKRLAKQMDHTTY